MKIQIKREIQIQRTPRVLQLESMFDVPPSKKSSNAWDVDLPLDDHEWNVGLIVGPSGCGKSTVARELFSDAMVDSFDWDPKKSVLDCFPEDMPVKDVVATCGAVGFNSPPSWLRPFGVLSNGEQFRVTMARALAEKGDQLVVVDEFTSVVDRKVAKVASHAVQKAVRKRGGKFIAVTCHMDVLQWLQPDWVFYPGSGDFKWRHLRRRPRIELDIRPVDRAEWRHFGHHHYMSGSLHSSAKCVGGFIEDECVAFAAYLRFPHPVSKNIMHGHRLVVLPDYQGLGIGGRMDDWIGQYLWERGYRYRNVVAHPAMVAYYSRSPRWERERTAAGRTKFTHKSRMKKRIMAGGHRITSSFEYRAPAEDRST